MFSSLTPSEHYRLTGTLRDEDIDALLLAVEEGTDVETAVVKIEEGMSGLYSEDFLCDLMNDMRKLQTNLRGANREAMTALIAKAEDLQQQLFNQGDYGRSELRDALKALGA
ncbi:hypothetical protein [Methyloversatilis sp.]|uniref:hypothetical protein n=1 Tax=Methyloversatilis sp. TaxID=2569862 RepID=UPI0035B354E1